MPGPAKLYTTNRTDTPFQVVYADPTRREKSGRAKRVPKWFADRADAETYRDTINRTLLIEGTGGVHFDATIRADAMAARQHLDAQGHAAMGLLQLAQRYTTQVSASATASRAIGEEVKQFLEDREHIDGASVETVKNLRVRLWLWIDLAKLTCVGDITRDSVEVLRARPVQPQTRKNDLAAASSFCTWLVDKRRLDHHPLKGLKRPKVHHGKKATLTTEQCAALLQAAQAAGRLGTLAVMLFAGARPSELSETKLIYGRHPLTRIEGGKLRGRANRAVPMLPALRAWLAAAGNPAQVPELTRYERETIGDAAGIVWTPDVCRHTYISNRLQLAQNDARVAKEGGTSEGIIYRHYHGLKTPAEARAWAKLRPVRPALTEAPAAATVAP